MFRYVPEYGSQDMIGAYFKSNRGLLMFFVSQASPRHDSFSV